MTTPQATPLTASQLDAIQSNLARGVIILDSAAPGLIRDLLATITQLRAENAAMVEALRFIHDTFKTDMAQGYKTKDKTFAVVIAARALADPAAAGKALLERLEKAENEVQRLLRNQF